MNLLNSTTPPDVQADILIVDDTPANLQVLSQVLKDSGHKVRAVPNGLLALRAVDSRKPDLILLDINMPEMDGYEVCRRLKTSADTEDIPIIFISALNETLDKVKAFEFGAADYMTKPFQFEEVQARVSVQLKLRRLQQELLDKNQSLEASLNRQQALEVQRENLIHMMVHDMRSPLSGMLGYLSLLEMFSSAWPPKHQTYLQRCQESTDSLIKMISTILDIHKMESGDMLLRASKVEISSVARKASEALGGMAINNPIEIENELDQTEALQLEADAEMVQRVIENLLGNALKFSPDGAPVRIRLSPHADQIKVGIQDQGPGIPAEMHERIFDKFGQVEARKHSTGLGLTFCKLAVEAHGGQIGLDSQVGQGSTFWFTLPAQVQSELAPSL